MIMPSYTFTSDTSVTLSDGSSKMFLKGTTIALDLRDGTFHVTTQGHHNAGFQADRAHLSYCYTTGRSCPSP